MKKIKYKVFASRKKFNIISWIKSTSNKTYESFSEFLSNRNVFPPGTEYWDKAIKFYNSTIKIEEPVQEPEPVQEIKSKRRRRRKNVEEKKQE